MRYPDGWTVTVQKFEELPSPSPRVSTAAPGFRLVVVTLRFDNGSSTAIAPQTSEFKLQDSNGVRRGSHYMGFRQERPDELKSNDLAPGGFVVGTIVFEAPRDDRQLTLVYESRRRASVLVQLY